MSKVKAATLNQLGLIYANKGEVEQAIALFNQSLEYLNVLVMSKAKQRRCTNWEFSTPTEGEVD